MNDLLFKTFISILIICFLGACDEEIEDDENATTCACEMASDGGPNCAFSNTITREWPKQQGVPCSQSTNFPVNRCCFAPRTVSNFSNTFTNSTTLLLASSDDSLSEKIVRDNLLTASSRDCPVECGGDSSQCLSLPNAAGASDSMYTFLDLYKLAVSQNKENIDKVSVMAAFNQTEDPCERGSLELNGDSGFTNRGKQCKVVYEIKNDNTIYSATITIPQSLQVITNRNVIRNSFKFITIGEGAVLSFNDTYLEHDYGGIVRSVSLTSNKAYLETEKGCIEL